MLILSRKIGESLRIMTAHGTIEVHVMSASSGREVRIGVEAPKTVRILRAELPPDAPQNKHNGGKRKGQSNG